MLSVLMFNMGGYFIIYQILDVRATAMLDKRIEEGDIQAQEQVEFRVTFELPYPVHEQQLESTNRVYDNGIPYDITSQEYKDYTLTLVGVRDQWAQHANQVMDAYNKASNGDLDADRGLVSSLKNLVMGFDYSPAVSLIGCDEWVRTLKYASAADQFLSIGIPVDPQPPRA